MHKRINKWLSLMTAATLMLSSVSGLPVSAESGIAQAEVQSGTVDDSSAVPEESSGGEDSGTSGDQGSADAGAGDNYSEDDGYTDDDGYIDDSGDSDNDSTPSDGGDSTDPVSDSSSVDDSTDADSGSDTGDSGSSTASDAQSPADSTQSSAADATAAVDITIQPSVSIDMNRIPAVLQASDRLNLSEILGASDGYGIVADTIDFDSSAEEGQSPVVLLQRTNFSAAQIIGSAGLLADLMEGSEKGFTAADLADYSSLCFSETTDSLNVHAAAEDADQISGEDETAEYLNLIEEDGEELRAVAYARAEAVSAASSELFRRAGDTYGTVLTQAGGADESTASAKIAEETAAAQSAAEQSAADQNTSEQNTSDRTAADTELPELTVDVTALSADGTFYINIDADGILQRIAAGELIIRKQSGQKIVFTSMASNVSIGTYTVYSNGSQGTSAYSQNSRSLMSDISENIIWNFPNAVSVKIGRTAGIFIVPQTAASVLIANESQVIPGAEAVPTNLDQNTADAQASTGRILTSGTVYAENVWYSLAAADADSAEVQNADSAETASEAEERINTFSADSFAADDSSETVELTFAAEKNFFWSQVPSEEQQFVFTLEEISEGGKTDSEETDDEETDNEGTDSEKTDDEGTDNEGTDSEKTDDLSGENSSDGDAVEAEAVFPVSELDNSGKAVKTASFAALTFSEEGEWKYRMKETQGTSDAVIYDETEYLLTVTVTRAEDQSLKAEVTCVTALDGEESEARSLAVTDNAVEPLSFTNIYAAVNLTIPTYHTLCYYAGVDQDGSKNGMRPAGNSIFTLNFSEQSGDDSDGSSESDDEAADSEIDITFRRSALPPVQSGKSSRTVGQTVNLASIRITGEGTRTFELKEEDGGQPGYTYDSEKVYTITVTTELQDNELKITDVNVKDSSSTTDGESGKSVWDSERQAIAEKSLVFSNTYKPAAAVISELKVGKTVSGTDSTSETFRFELRRLPSDSSKKGALTAEAEISGEGTTAFMNGSAVKKFTFSRTGTYTYLATETDTAVGFAYDTSVWYCVITVTDENGALKTSVTWRREGETHTDDGFVPSFDNQYVTANFNFRKVDADSVNTGLSGAVFEVYRIASLDKASDEYKNAADLLSGGKVDYDQLTRQSTVSSGSQGQVTVPDLLAGTYYVIREMQAPTGYQKSGNPIILRTVWDADTSSVSVKTVSSGNMTLGVSDSTLKWYDHKVSVRIDKVNTDGKLIKGAKLQLLDSDGNILEKWSSGRTQGHKVKASLRVGATYTIHEVQAPEGFTIAEDVTFTVTAVDAGGYHDSVMQVVTMTDPGQGTGEDAVNGGGSGSGTGADGTTAADAAGTATGDTTKPWLWLILAAAAAVVIGIGVARRKKH